MAEVQRGNVFLTIPDDDIEKYMAKGFSVVDANGKVIRQSVPTEIGQLQKAYSEHVDEIKKLTAKVASLESQLAEAKSGVEKTPEEPQEENGWEDWQEEEKQPTKSRKRKN